MTTNLRHKIKFSDIRNITSEIKERCRSNSPVLFVDKKTAKRIIDSLSSWPDIFDWDRIHSGYSIGQFDGVEIKIHEL